MTSAKNISINSRVQINILKPYTSQYACKCYCFHRYIYLLDNTGEYFTLNV